jgi:hypothetical protein
VLLEGNISLPQTFLPGFLRSKVAFDGEIITSIPPISIMKTTTMLATLVALAATVSASPLKRAALFTGKAYEITNLKLEDVSRGNVSINFNVHDPDPLTDATGTCSGSWPHGSEPRDTFVWLHVTASAISLTDHFTPGRL